MCRDGITVGGPIFRFPSPLITSRTHPFTVSSFHLTGREVVSVSDMARRPAAGAFAVVTLHLLQDLLWDQAVP